MSRSRFGYLGRAAGRQRARGLTRPLAQYGAQVDTDEMMTLSGKRYDVALSFAGEHRDYVSQVAAELGRRGLTYFYDSEAEEYLWGKDLTEELNQIYNDAAGVVVLFIS